MKLPRRIVWVSLLLLLAAEAQSPLLVVYQKTVEVNIPEATAAYSLDSAVADVRITGNGRLLVQGRAPGTTNIVVVTAAGIQSIQVTVPVPAPVYPAGFIPPAQEGSTVESGSYEVRYNNDPSQLTNTLVMKREQGDSFERVQVVNATFFSATSSQSQIGFPLASYEISHSRWGVVAVDQLVDNSPLTLDHTLVRGLHFRWHDWQFHGGFTMIATFQGLFLVTDPEEVLGLSRSFHLNEDQSLVANLYYFKNPASQANVASSGFTGSLAWKLKYKNRANLISEAGAGRSLAFASRGNLDTDHTHMNGDFRVQPASFASLALNNQRGVFGDLNVSHDFAARFSGNANVTESDYKLPLLRQNIFTGNSLLNYKLTRHFTLSSGAEFSRFSSSLPPGPVIHTLNLPVGVDFSLSHFGAGFQYQRTTGFDGSGGNDFSGTLRAGWGHFQGAAFYRHDVNVPTLTSIFALVPGLQDLLERSGIVVTTPDQLAQLLRDSALLTTLGFAGPLSVNIAPVRNDSGASFTWTSPGTSHRQLNVSYFNSTTDLIPQGRLSFTSVNASYSQHIGSNDDLIVSGGSFRTITNGSTSVRPLISVSLQHRFFSVPSFILPGRHGVIQGHVFRDNELQGKYSGQQPILSGVEIQLDGGRTTHSDARGYYEFRHVPFGIHHVEAKFSSPEPFFYTTDSPATAEINTTTDFGVNFAQGRIFGFVLNDADKGVSGITVELQGSGPPHTLVTGGDGKFTFQGLPQGIYSVRTLPETFPSGYSLQDLHPQSVKVTQGAAEKTTFTVKALRAISGKITYYDTTELKPAPLPGIVVRLKELSLESTTGAGGAYLFRNLPAGTYTLALVYKDKEITRTVIIPADPANLRDMDLNVGAR
ncbi:MAG TPA: carboxypeptidase regulatory-like domain-containing protein [Candidatus Angelobacter sp.]|nr:carboxypeptidase regulatory-like domain-containing protein [Candidatus Angelobacter sp.]